MTKADLIKEVDKARQALAIAEKALLDFNTSVENNVFATLEEACDELEDRLIQFAKEDCEGSYNCGDPEYRQEFLVDGVKYVAILEVEYDRHDKTYYYIYSRKFRYELI
jgi:hypothetical protein